MLKKLPTVFIFFTAIITLIIAFKQTQQTDEPQDDTDERLEHGHSWQAYGLTSWQIDKAEPASSQTRVYAKEVFYRNQDKTSTFQQPYIIRDTPDQQYILQSQSGSSRHDTEITLNQNVIIHSFTKTDVGENRILKTEQITYNTTTGLLTSPVYTVIIQPNATLSGVGFKADTQTGTYYFLSQVKTHYQPEPSAQQDKATQSP